ncbi:hypothetical protein [Mariniblastus fucicola]|uniref:Uncharacterized protein n=1 Tax=Mariniblastus fucicola TaxID=980251 RepID=A0A5B9PEZ1_9BACT|nr:hypothetical protein [Mariniblastus fucicola]QEG21551.1 hypothetical protein MFFC18_14080 [Mariniblastus fucicola]
MATSARAGKVVRRTVYFVGTESEVAHHAAPLMDVDSFGTQVIDPAEVVDAANDGDIAIFFSEHFDRFRNAVVELKAKRVATIYLVDGILEWRNAWQNRDDEPACPFTMRPVLCDKVVAIGPSQARVLSGWGNAGKIEVVGIPRLDQRTRQWRESTGYQPAVDNSRFRILVSTAKTPGFTDEQIETTVRSLSDLKQYFEATTSVFGRQIEVEWRLTAGLDQRIDVANRLSNLNGTELHAAIERCDAVVTAPSTSMLEAMLQHKPTALLDYHLCPQYVPAAWNIRSSQSIGVVIEQLANPSAARLQFQNGVLGDALQVCESATDRLVQLIHSMFAETDRQNDTTKSFEFTSSLLPNAVWASELGGAHCKMDFASVFANYNEFTDDCDVPELQAQLAHARREIEHLHRIEDGLRAELAEAHSIFESIHQHPIAGPIVRIRERFIQFMNRNRKAT